jgi:hypothetical protein
MDATSPAHRGFQRFDPYRFTGSYGGASGTGQDMYDHWKQENTISNPDLIKTARLIQYFFAQTFGADAAQDQFGGVRTGNLVPVLTVDGWVWRDPVGITVNVNGRKR